MLQLRNIHIKNYRIHKDTIIFDKDKKLGDFVALVGKNDIGKSSILSALDAFFNGHEVESSDFNDNGDDIEITVNGYNRIIGETKRTDIANGDLQLRYVRVNKLVDNPNSALPEYLYLKPDSKIDSSIKDYNLSDFLDYCESCADEYIANNQVYRISERYLKDAFRVFRIIDQFRPLINKNQQVDDIFRKFVEEKDNDILRNNEELVSTYLKENSTQKHYVDLLFELLNRHDFYDNKGVLNLVEMSLFKDLKVDGEDVMDILSGNDIGKILQKEKEILDAVAPIFDECRKKDWLKLFADFIMTFNNSKDIAISKRGSGIQRLCELYFQLVDNLTELDFPVFYIIGIDEPEISLHPEQQRKFVSLLKEVSKYAQIFITTHSPYIVKHLDEKDICVLKEVDGKIVANPIKERMIDKYFSLNEVNFIAFNESSIEYHQELFTLLQDELLIPQGKTQIKQIDDLFPESKEIWVEHWHDKAGNLNEKEELHSLPYCVRNSINHPYIKNEHYKERIDDSINMMIDMLIKSRNRK